MAIGIAILFAKHWRDKRTQQKWRTEQQWWKNQSSFAQ